MPAVLLLVHPDLCGLMQGSYTSPWWKAQLGRVPALLFYSMVFPFPHLGNPQDPPLVLNDAVEAYQIGNGSSAWVRDQHDLLSFPSPCPWVTFKR